MRPGNIRSFGDFGEFSFLGSTPTYINRGFGKDQDFEPVAAPAAPATYKKLELAPGVFYQQDERCKINGEKMDLVKCDGTDCDPGEMEESCTEDSEYKKLEAEADKINAQLEQEEQLKLELEQLELEDERKKFDDARAARAADRASVTASMPQFEEEGIPPAMIAIIGGGMAVMLGLSLFMMRKKPASKPAAATAAARKRRKRRKR